jgi:heme oxygenase
MIIRPRTSPPGAASIRLPAAKRIGVRPPSAQLSLALSAQLRASTRTVHAHTEETFELDRWVADRAAYADLLTLMWGFHTAAESALAGIDGWEQLTPSIDLRARRRAFRIAQDLHELGRPWPTSVVTHTLQLETIGDGLGCLYVVEGSTLGGRVVAARAQAALGPRLPTAFFADPSRNVGQDWNGLRTSLDSFGFGANAATRRSVVDAAHRTFGAFAAVFVPGRSWR